MTNHSNELCGLSACEAVKRLEQGELTSLDLIDAALTRIAEVDQAVNAVPTVCEERARAQARALTEANTSKAKPERGWLAGLPVLIKDLVDVSDVRTTYGSTIFSDNKPSRSAIEAQRLERHGAIILGKTNTPEFGAGANTFNEVFGKTRNPWNTSLTCGGSSGGAAVALATGMAWLADGSDLGGSLRTPASFCGVVGLRPSAGRVPRGPSTSSFSTLSVAGPMARNVQDLALMLDAMAGLEPEDPLSFDAPAISFSKAIETPWAPEKIAYSVDLGGITPVNHEISTICGNALRQISENGSTVIENRCPDLSQSVRVFETLRAELFAASHAPLLDAHRDELKPEVIWNIERGLALNADDIGWAERERSLMQQRMAAFFDEHDLLVCPTAIVPPFDVDIRYLEKLGDHDFPSYIDWVSIAFAITLCGNPVISVPCGFTGEGLPVGLQLVGPPRGEAQLLRAATFFEQVFGYASKLPIDPIIRH